MRETLLQADKLGVLPEGLGADLARLAALRNKVVHDNVAVDEDLLLYDRLASLSCASFAAHHAFQALVAVDLVDAPPTVVVDRQYLRSLYDRRRQSAMDIKGMRRLEGETLVPRYVIDLNRASAFWRLVRKVQTSGD